MRLAVNYSPQAAQLVRSGDIHVDLFKCPDWPDMLEAARRERPVYVHFPLIAGRLAARPVNWQQIASHLAQTGTRYVNMHLAPHTQDFPGMAIDTRDPQWCGPVVERMVADVAIAKHHFGSDQIILENVPWDPSPQFSIPLPALEPATVCQVVRETECGLLLDVAHARIAAAVLGCDARAYLSALPVERIREVHITGTLLDENGMWQDHFPMTVDDWALTEYVFEKIAAGQWSQPDIVALEYGGVGDMFAWRSSSQVLAADVPRLGELIARYAIVE